MRKSKSQKRISKLTWLALIMIIIGLTVFSNKEVIGYIFTGLGVVILIYDLIKPSKTVHSD
jgi:formate-dependent nitrite reductase membrane component NrfD